MEIGGAAGIGKDGCGLAAIAAGPLMRAGLYHC